MKKGSLCLPEQSEACPEPAEGGLGRLGIPFRLKRQQAMFSGSVTLIIRSSLASSNPNWTPALPPSVANPCPQNSGSSSQPTFHLCCSGQSSRRSRPILPIHLPLFLSIAAQGP